MSIQTVNPNNNQLVKSFDPISPEDVNEKIQNAHRAFQNWRTTSFSERREIIVRVAENLKDNSDEYAELSTLEMGKRIEESRYEIDFCVRIFEFYANGAQDFLADERMDHLNDAEAYIQYAAKGALLGVMPWNFPFYQVTRFAAPNIMAGNTVLIKHATNVPQCAMKMEQIFSECGLPEGVYTNLMITSDQVADIIKDDRIVGVSLTGSEPAGAAVAAEAGKQIKPSVLELGGNDPFIILEDADMDHVVEMAVKGRMTNTGQSCVASKRFIVVDEVADEFLHRFKEAMENLKMGDPMDPDTDVGPLSTESAAEDLMEKVQATIDAGATVVLGGGRPEREGAFYNPTILTNVTPDMPTYDQELFGPVATVYRVPDEAAAIELANDSSYGLGGSVFTQDLDRGKRVAEKIDTGMVFINQPTNSQEDLPFGGTKNSGYGRELSRLGIMEFVNKKLIHAPLSA